MNSNETYRGVWKNVTETHWEREQDENQPVHGMSFGKLMMQELKELQFNLMVLSFMHLFECRCDINFL